MTQTSIGGGGLYFPNPTLWIDSSGTPATMDAATEKAAHIGYLYIDGRPAGTKTLSNVGNIQFRTGTSTFANAGTSLDIGIQGVASGSGPIVQPDGSFSVKRTLTGGGGGITSGAWNTVTMATGTVSLAHGDLIAIVWDMTARAGVDSVIVTNTSNIWQSARSAQLPNTNAFVSSAWQTARVVGAGNQPNVIISFDDGTLGWIDGTLINAGGAIAAEAFQDSTNPDERGMLFQIPWNCKIDAIWAAIQPASASPANADLTLKLYSTPTGTPGLLTSKAIPAENLGAGGNVGSWMLWTLPSEISLSRNTDYCVTVLATGTANISLASIPLAAAAHRVQLPGGTTLAKATRNNSTGSFDVTATTTMMGIGVRISSFDDGTGTPSVVPSLRGTSLQQIEEGISV
jgi:hypothetical protein